MKVILIFAFILGRGACMSIGDRRFARKACSKSGIPIQPPNRVNTTSRLIELRKAMSSEPMLRDLPIDAFFITTDDDHQSEYVDDYDKRLQYISGFSGSYGVGIVTTNGVGRNKSAVLWTDGRYHLQADDQLNCDWLLMREGNRNIPTPAEWLKANLAKGSRIGADPKLLSHALWSELEKEFQESELSLIPVLINPIDLIWIDRPPKRNKNVFVWDIKYAGKNWTTKVEETRQQLQKAKANATIITALDEIAWLLNIRGRDIPCNPFVRSYLILTMQKVTLYVNASQLIEHNVMKHLNSDYGVSSYSVIIKNYTDVWKDLPTEAQKWTFLIPSPCTFSPGSSHAIFTLVPKNKRVLAPSPVVFLKARKNPVEIRGMETAHIRDAVAMIRFLAYIEKWFSANNWTELDVVKILDEYRFEQQLSLGNSFRTIAAFGMNGALPHYEPTPNTNAVIFDNSTLVIDSGGQYYDGTTDVTRTLHLGEPTQDQKHAYTRVLMGAIQLSSLTFPANMDMSDADVMARAPLWEIGLDYLHETGHGVGTFLSVHESPITLSYKEKKDQYFEPGYFLSNEPGYYREADFGVRLENVLEVIEKPWLHHHSSDQAMLGFRDVTLVPYEPKLIDLSLLSHYHRRWLNNYNAKIRIQVGEELKKQNRTEAFFWMMQKTQYIPENNSCRIKISTKLSVFLVTLLVAKTVGT